MSEPKKPGTPPDFIAELAAKSAQVLMSLDGRSEHHGELSGEQQLLFETLKRELELKAFSPREAERCARYFAGGLPPDLLSKVFGGSAQERGVKATQQLERAKDRKESSQLHASTTMRRAKKAFDLLEALVPQRIANEEIGDALELIHRWVKARRPKWMIYLKVATTFFWVLTHSVLDWIIKAGGAAKLLIGKHDGKADK
jgi:hypothetical protein